MLLPLIIHITQLENPNLFQQARNHWWTQTNSWTQTPINPNHNKKKKKKRKRKTQFNPDQNPYITTASFLHHWSTQINHQNPTGTKTKTSPINPDKPPNPTGTKTHTSPINPDYNRKNKKKTQINPDQHPDTATTRSVFPPSLINPDQPPKSHRNNPDTADQPRSQ